MNDCIEIWKDIPEGEGRYQVSNYGRIRSIDHYASNGKGERLYKGQLLKPTIGTDKYYHFMLYRNGKGDRKVYLLHRLMAMVFLPNHNNLPEVNHKDENKLNNFIYINPDGSVDPERSNLEWCTSKYNANYGTRNKRSVEGRIKNNTFKKVYMLNLNNEVIMEFYSLGKAAEYVNGSRGNIWSCCNGKAKTAYGYKWRYKLNSLN